ncbi:hypothetical protein F5Y18DRAFT_424631 [Xylariaceae sp. FL1019]|nr:hypothetical protein F5Y18DRAFT_424631 [Xylariaceae sp. FL1019]
MQALLALSTIYTIPSDMKGHLLLGMLSAAASKGASRTALTIPRGGGGGTEETAGGSGGTEAIAGGSDSGTGL